MLRSTRMTEAQMLEAFSAAVRAAGGVRGFARLANVQPSYVSRALRCEDGIGPTLLAAAGIERIVRYRRMTPTEPAP